jgi:hypothetical protein
VSGNYARAVARQTFSTKSFVPGHVAGAAILLFGTITLAKLLIARHETERAQLEADLTRPSNDRGQYGKRP